MYVPSAVKLLDLVEVEEEDDEEEEEDEREPASVFDDEDEEDDEDEDEEDFVDEEDPSSRVPHVSVALSSTSWAERDTDGLRAVSPGSSMAVSS